MTELVIFCKLIVQSLQGNTIRSNQQTILNRCVQVTQADLKFVASSVLPHQSSENLLSVGKWTDFEVIADTVRMEGNNLGWVELLDFDGVFLQSRIELKFNVPFA